MRIALHITSIITTAITIWAFYTGAYVWLLGILAWYLIGLVSAIYHTKWIKDRTFDQDKPSGLGVFYTWYSLSGLVLLALTAYQEFVSDFGKIA